MYTSFYFPMNSQYSNETLVHLDMHPVQLLLLTLFYSQVFLEAEGKLACGAERFPARWKFCDGTDGSERLFAGFYCQLDAALSSSFTCTVLAEVGKHLALHATDFSCLRHCKKKKVNICAVKNLFLRLLKRFDQVCLKTCLTSMCIICKLLFVPLIWKTKSTTGWLLRFRQTSHGCLAFVLFFLLFLYYFTGTALCAKYFHQGSGTLYFTTFF